ncbi:S66 peptidase family protein [Pedosphaera parvula]|uniref:Peptidase U61 LD-carboxypeptidase A n=1 Tax=Pedosphaera parvula (strain Ellin514) TaxID=320771 RepID=B9XNN0_PEDPL|nr:LD-carboxypeptidase [Pedosphaera parvula]EEF58570.1 peptidase U61 LD-carboxypeptidase A [Pedosphaera parvula Ellin514]
MPNIPDRLRLGDTVALIAPASAPPDPKSIDESLAVIEKFGFKPKLSRHARKRWGFLAGSDRERASDLMEAFGDRRVKGIFCVRGGYGTPRLLPLLDYQKIRENPKVFVGYSDITALHCAFLKKSNLLSFHGPMFASDFIKKNYPDFSCERFLKILTEPEFPGSICQDYTHDTVSILRRGKVSGELIGGNISLLCSSLGTPYQPSFRGKILFFEDLDEVPYRYDRLLTQLSNAGLLQQVAGIAVGICVGAIDPKAKKMKEYRQTFEDVLKERLSGLKVPLVCGLPFGHTPYNTTIPVGGRATLDANKGDLILEGPVVR